MYMRVCKEIEEIEREREREREKERANCSELLFFLFFALTDVPHKHVHVLSSLSPFSFSFFFNHFLSHLPPSHHTRSSIRGRWHNTYPHTGTLAEKKKKNNIKSCLSLFFS